MATNVCVVKTLLTAKRKSNGHFSSNGQFAGTHKNHKNWYTTNKNEFTVHSVLVQDFISDLACCGN
jgi:hypothetical protein